MSVGRLSAQVLFGAREPDLSHFQTLSIYNFCDGDAGCCSEVRKPSQCPVLGGLAINHFSGLRRALVFSLGLARLPRHLLGDEVRRGTLVELLRDWPLPVPPISLV